MQQKFANAFSVGIIDEDKRQVSYVKEFSEIARTPSLRLKKHGSKSHDLIMVSPAMDGFLLNCSLYLELSLQYWMRCLLMHILTFLP